MNIAVGHLANSTAVPAIAERGHNRGHYGKAPVMNCPACGAKALCRSSLEISPTYRSLYYRCENLACSMTFSASLAFEKIISPSGVSAEFRPAIIKAKRAPGHDFGQMNIFDILAPVLPD
ncbi:MAG: ogr/Delta-like zinc finger family protein [Sphingobium sp.]